MLEKQRIKSITGKPIIFPVVGFILGIIVWIVDAMIDVLILDEEQTILSNVFMPDEPTELWMRTLVLLVFVMMGFFSRHVIIKQNELHRILLDFQKELAVQARTDPLTSLYNRREFSKILDQELDRFHRYQKTFSLISIDIDHFKKINDTYGHEIGDKVLKQFSDVLTSNTRNSDSVCRWGGEEFILLFIESSTQETVQVLENIQKTLKEITFNNMDKITASYGVTQVRKDDTQNDIVNRSDKAMYKAKENGRNRIEVIDY